MRISISVLLCLALTPTYSGPGRLALPRENQVRAVPVQLFPDNPARRRVGRLTYLDGVELVESGTGIGGYSAVRVQGDRFTLLSDGGNLLHFRWRGGTRLSDAEYSVLPAGPGRGWEKRDRDSESLAVDPRSGAVWVGFERKNEIWRYDPSFQHATGHSKPDVMSNWQKNGGAEAIAFMPERGLVVLSESTRPHRAPGRQAIYFLGDPVEAPLRGFTFVYHPPQGMQPTDAVALPDGRLLVLNRGLDLPFDFSASLVLIERDAIRPGAAVRGAVIAALKAPALHDNFEGLALTSEGGRQIVWLLSDNNQFPLQRTLLLKFALEI